MEASNTTHPEGILTKPIDLRSDTVTQPTEEMRDAMRGAEVGDDYYFEDPTVARLEDLSAEMLGKEAGLFVSSGTMGNSVSIFTWTNPGEVIIAETSAHVVRAERGHLGIVSAVQPKTVDGRLGVMDPERIEEAIAAFPEGTAFPKPSLICIENTHNAAGGTCWSPRQMHAAREVADRQDLRIHVDGARIFNAAVAQRIDVKDLAKDADSLTFCLSKGLSCPFGSVVVGGRAFISKCRLARQMLGGGMRQGGIMAAAGIVGLQKMVNRLEDDHQNARLLAEELSRLGFEIQMESVQTNMVFISGSPAGISMEQWVTGLRSRRFLVNSPSRGGRLRMVTHCGIARADVLAAIAATEAVLRSACAT
jgi:threonine aldolase